MTASVEWVVLIEGGGNHPGSRLDGDRAKRLLAYFEEYSPYAIYAADRCAIQLVITDEAPEKALAIATTRWRHAATCAGLTSWNLLRAEIKTHSELEAELAQLSAEPAVGMVPSDARALEAAYEATRSLLRMRSPSEAASILSALTYRLGGIVVPASEDDPNALAMELSFDVTEPIRPSAERLSVARLQLEEVLPMVIDDAWCAISLLRGGRTLTTDGPSSD